MYHALANVNNILENIESKKALFTDRNYEIIKGEALALRAYLHFDLLRMFAPSYKSNPTAKAIPYVTTVSTKSTPFSNVTETIDKVIADLTAAKILLKFDPILSTGYKIGYPGEANINEDAAELFLQNRRHRMNYYTVYAELARVYLYKGDYQNCLVNTQVILDAKKFPFTNQDDFFDNDLTKRDRIFYKELITAWYIPKQRDMLSYLFNSDPAMYSATTPQLEDIYDKNQSGADDWRFKQWFLKKADPMGGLERSLLEKYVNNTTPTPNRHPLMAPAVRLSEIYYMAAEASFDSSPQKALDYYNTIRSQRGIGDNLTEVPDKATFINLLIADARKEFYGESQIFYMYKRLNHAVKMSATIDHAPSDKIFVFPIPIDEQAYRGN